MVGNIQALQLVDSRDAQPEGDFDEPPDDGRSHHGEGADRGDAEQLNALYIERGWPRFGVEFDETFYPQEANLEKVGVSFDKGCYLGQEVVYMLENRGHVKKKLVPLDLAELVPPGTPLTTPAGDAVGEVKSSVVGPLRGKPVAIATVKWAQAKAGTELRAGTTTATDLPSSISRRNGRARARTSP